MMKNSMILFGLILTGILTLESCGQNNTSNNDNPAGTNGSIGSTGATGLSADADAKAKSDAEITKKADPNSSPESEPNLNFEQLYPILKKSLLKIVCESYRIEEKSNNLQAYSKESDMFLSSWSWDLNNNPLLIKDIDNDGLIDYTLELSNEGGGCGGQIGESERWTLFGSKPDRFKLTHTIPYRSERNIFEEKKYYDKKIIYDTASTE